MRLRALRSSSLILLPLLLFCLLPGSQTAVDEDPLDQIERLLKADSVSEALEQAESLAAFSPLEAEAQALYGLALLRNGDFVDAEQFSLAALGLDEHCADAHLGMARIATGRNRFERAVFHFREAVKSDRFRGEALLEFAKLLAESGDYAGALRMAEIAPQELTYLGDARVADVRATLEFYKRAAEAACYIVPESFQKTSIDLLPSNKNSGGFDIAVTMVINGENTGRFCIETSVPETIILSRSLADHFSLEGMAHFTLLIPGSGSVAADGVLLPNLTLGGLEMERVPALVVDDSSLPAGTSGIIGTGFLKRFNFAVDMQGGLMQITRGDRPDLLLRGIDPKRAVTRLPIFLGPMPAIELSINGSAPAPFIIASGLEATLVDSSWFDSSIAPSLPAGSTAAATAKGPAGLQQGRLFAADKLRFGGLELSGVPLVVLDLSTVENTSRQRVAGFIGRDLLLRFRLHFNLAQPELILENY
jgi:hypothetical protein